MPRTALILQEFPPRLRPASLVEVGPPGKSSAAEPAPAAGHPSTRRLAPSPGGREGERSAVAPNAANDGRTRANDDVTPSCRCVPGPRCSAACFVSFGTPT